MKSSVLAAILFVGFLSISTNASALVLTPNVFDDPAPAPLPNGCTTGGRCSLREAVLASTANNGADTINLGEGTYTLTRPSNGTPQNGVLDLSEPDEDFEITIQGAGSDKTKILADPGLNDGVMSAFGDELIVNLQGFTIQGGRAFQFGLGGGFFVNSEGDDSAYTLTDVSFVDNQAGMEGGGAWLRGRLAKIVIDGGTYRNNKVLNSGGIGGGLRIGGEVLGVERAELRNLVVTENEVSDGRGGGIFVGENLEINLSDSQITKNKALNPDDSDVDGTGGGIYISNQAEPFIGEIINCQIQGNEADGNPDKTDGSGGNAGAGLAAFGGGTLSIINTTLADNVATNDKDGGGAVVFNGSDGGLEVIGSTFSGNKARDGAGLHQRAIGGTLKEITNSTFFNNEASRDGGAIFIRRDDDGFTFNNLTITANSAGGAGGGIDNIGHPILVRNSILSANDSGGDSDDCTGDMMSGLYNIFASPDDLACPPVGGGLNPADQTSNPLLGALANNGGPTLTLALMLGSPALGGGNPAGCVDGGGVDLTVDQRGAPRQVDKACDIGAVETSITDLEMVKSANGSSFTVGQEITYTLTVNNLGNDISAAIITDTLPSQVNFVSADSPCTESVGVVTCNLAGVNGGANASVNVIVMAAAEGSATNSATVSGTDIDTNPNNNSSSVEVTISGSVNPPGNNGGCSLSEKADSGRLQIQAFAFLGLVCAAWAAVRRVRSQPSVSRTARRSNN